MLIAFRLREKDRELIEAVRKIERGELSEVIRAALRRHLLSSDGPYPAMRAGHDTPPEPEVANIDSKIDKLMGQW